LINCQQISANLFDPPSDSIAVLRPQHIKSLEYHQREVPCSISAFCFITRTALLVSNMEYAALPLGKQQRDSRLMPTKTS